MMIIGGQRVIDQPFPKDEEWSGQGLTILLCKHHKDGGTQWEAADNQ